jgi:hypothetical protein
MAERQEINIRLEEREFRDLVAGRIVVRRWGSKSAGVESIVRIILADIGFVVMDDAIAQAEADAKRGLAP